MQTHTHVCLYANIYLLIYKIWKCFPSVFGVEIGKEKVYQKYWSGLLEEAPKGNSKKINMTAAGLMTILI